MQVFGFSPLDYFNRWLVEPIRIVGPECVQTVMETLNRHPFADDDTAQDYFMPARRYREEPGRFRILGENQDNWYCFVDAGTETEGDPPVYFETCLDLETDCNASPEDIIDGNHALVAPKFSQFIWHMLGRQICVRMEVSPHFTPGVHGILFDVPVTIDGSFVNPLGREFPAGFTCLISPDCLCIPDWGVAFLKAESGRRFQQSFSPVVLRHWN